MIRNKCTLTTHPSDLTVRHCPSCSGNYKGRLGLPYMSGKPCSMCKDHCTRNKLCTNACYYTDLWSNCAELVRTFRAWVCETNTKEGRERREFCGATCNCKDKIYYHHG